VNLLAWILSGVLAALFIASGAMKLVTPRKKLLANPRLGWVNDFPDPQVKTIGALEVLGGLGLILPWLLDVARVLTPLSAVGLAIIMAGALVVHGRRGEAKEAAPVNGVLLVAAVVVAIIRFSQL
jgi:uncharacterized membrane protein YphA (DoxX/SURF4 family)